MKKKQPPSNKLRVLLVTGMSGAGKTSALKALEDIGYEAVDNIPLSLLYNLAQPDTPRRGDKRPLAIGIDFRTRDFGIEAFALELDRLTGDTGMDVRVLFMDCDSEDLRRRYTETRHRHPLAQDRPVADGIALEGRLMAPLRQRADVVIDTTGFGPGELKHIIEGHFGTRGDHGLSVFVTSFSYLQGLPREADLVFDVRFLVNPHYDPGLKPLSGLDAAVGEYIIKDKDFKEFFNSLTGFLGLLLPRYAAEGKSYLTIAIGCTGGRHRSVFVAERLTGWLQSKDRNVSVRHRDLTGN